MGKRTKLQLCTKPKDDYILPDDWCYSKRIRGIATMHAHLYYKTEPCPPNGTKFRTINGQIENWEVKDDKVYINDEERFSRNDIKCVFMLPGKK